MRIVLGIDGSEHSATAADMIRSRPWPDGTIVRVFTGVLYPFAPPPAWPDDAEYEKFRLQQIADATALVERTADSLRRAGISVETAVRSGDPRTLLVTEAEQWPADLIVVGSRGVTGVASWLLGSVARSVVAHAPCSVEVVRHRRPSP